MEKNKYRAIVDRIVDGKHAVLLVGEEEIERILPADQLPPAVTEGSWLRIWFEKDDPINGGVQKMELDEVGSADARKRIEAKLARLKKRGRPR